MEILEHKNKIDKIKFRKIKGWIQRQVQVDRGKNQWTRRWNNGNYLNDRENRLLKNGHSLMDLWDCNKNLTVCHHSPERRAGIWESWKTTQRIMAENFHSKGFKKVHVLVCLCWYKEIWKAEWFIKKKGSIWLMVLQAIEEVCHQHLLLVRISGCFHSWWKKKGSWYVQRSHGEGVNEKEIKGGARLLLTTSSHGN